MRHALAEEAASVAILSLQQRKMPARAINFIASSRFAP